MCNCPADILLKRWSLQTTYSVLCCRRVFYILFYGRKTRYGGVKTSRTIGARRNNLRRALLVAPDTCDDQIDQKENKEKKKPRRKQQCHLKTKALKKSFC